jgi:hypothetical protein
MDDWTNNEAVAVRDFLSTRYGDRFFKALKNRLPSIKGDTMESMAISGARAAGYLACIGVINDLARGIPSTADDVAYPRVQ